MGAGVGAASGSLQNGTGESKTLLSLSSDYSKLTLAILRLQQVNSSHRLQQDNSVSILRLQQVNSIAILRLQQVNSGHRL